MSQSTPTIDPVRLRGIDPAADIAVIQTALHIEHEGIAAYRLAGASGLLRPETLAVALIFKGHHEQHRDALAALVRQTGASPVEPRPDEEYVTELRLGDLKNQEDVVKLATGLERGAASLYAAQIGLLQDHQLARLFGLLAADEAVHWTTLNNAAGTPIPASALLFA